MDAEAFITSLQQKMTAALTQLNQDLPGNSQVRESWSKGNGWISSHLLEA